MSGFSAGADAGDRRVFAALDLGTNNCRMLMARPNGGSFQVVDSFSRVTRLGEGLTSTGRLASDAMDRTVDALKRCADKLNRRPITGSRHVATEACRRASNGGEFLDRVSRETGIDLEIISFEEEATLALKGCSALLDPAIPYAVMFDIGGGSTEVLLVRFDEARSLHVEGCVSMPLGVVTVAEDCGGGDLCEKTFEAVAEHAMRLLAPFEAQYRVLDKIADGHVQMIGTSGTVTTLGGLHLNLPRYERTAVDGLTVDFDSLLGYSRRLCKMSLHQRAAEPCIGWQRADLVLAGCAILEAICRTWPVGKLRIADRGLREGLLMEMIHPAAVHVAARA
ncbi:MAG: Ppx/GppA family phosphatase [Alphaproteobacteria bacterium]|nr:Ppx/GppA family phosphatase [Alphaproteobacteria bacterium]